MNAREKEQYLREYHVLKGQGKPFFPYAVAKDSLMAVFVLFVIILMAVAVRRGARPEGRPDDDHLHAASGVVLLLPLRAAADHQAAGARVHRDGGHPDDLHGPAHPAAVHRPQPGASSATAADRDPDRRRRHLRDGVPDDRGRAGRRPDRDRAGDRSPVRAGQGGGRVGRLPGLSPDRPQRQRGARSGADRDRREPESARDPAHAAQPDGADAVLRRPGRAKPEQFDELVAYLSSLR